MSVLGEDAGRTVSRLEVSQIIEARMRETFELLRNEIRAAGVGMLPAGVILTGGGAQLAGAAELGREVLQMPVRIAAPSGIGGLVDTLLNPSYSTAVGLLQWGATSLAVGRAAPLRIGAGRRRPRPAARRDPEHLPVETRELTVRTGAGRGLHDLTAACASFVAEAADEGDGLLSIFVPHATAGLVVVEIGAGSDDDLMAALDRLLPRDEGIYRHRHGSPGHGADHVLPLLAPPSLTVPVIGGRLALGTWQSICLLDPNADNAVRTVRLSSCRRDRPGSVRRCDLAPPGDAAATGRMTFGRPPGTMRRYTSGQPPDPLSTGKATRVHRATSRREWSPLQGR